jgi:hypothetical protein
MNCRVIVVSVISRLHGRTLIHQSNAGAAPTAGKRFSLRQMISPLICAITAMISPHGSGFMTKTLLLSPRYTSDSIDLRRAALEENWHVERLNSYRVPESLQNQRVAIYGEALFVTIVAQELQQILLETPANWLMSLPQEYLQRDLQLTSLEEARKLNEARFIKPAEGKFFAAKIYQNPDELPAIGTQSEGMPVYIAEPVKWLSEFRCFILERQMESYSVYSRIGEIVEDWFMSAEEVTSLENFCEKFRSDERIAMPPAFVLDIGEIEGRGWAVIEANPVWASGIYGADAAKILKLLERSCIPAAELSDEDARWQIQRYSED